MHKQNIRMSIRIHFNLMAISSQIQCDKDRLFKVKVTMLIELNKFGQ